MRQLSDVFWSLGASVSKERRSGPVRAACLRSELTLGDWRTKMSRLDHNVTVFVWFGGFQILSRQFVESVTLLAWYSEVSQRQLVFF